MVLTATRIADPCVVVIFGASGDLSARKLGPALHNLQHEGLMGSETSVLGVSRTDMSDEAFRTYLREGLETHSRLRPTEESWSTFAEDVVYIGGDAGEATTFDEIQRRLDDIDRRRGTCGNRLWYLATHPDVFPVIAQNICTSGALDTSGWHRLVVEKPFGSDLASARELNATLRRYFKEDQIFRIDHYLGKETVQNLLVFRFANAIFEPVWNRRYIDNVQITVAEDIGIGDRGAFYERAGALRDVGQNHMLQLVAHIAMEPPSEWTADGIRGEKAKLLSAVRRWSEHECATTTARGQYEGYTDEPGVAPDSATETFFAMKVLVDNWRWAGVPFYLRTGKRLPARATEILIEFQEVPHLLFSETAVQRLAQNELAIRIQPYEGFSLRFGTKVPGPQVEVQTVDMEFDYITEFPSGTQEAYERLLLDAMLGDPTLFTRSDEIEGAWEIIDPVLACWASEGSPAAYPRGSWGPPASEELIRRDGRRWIPPTVTASG